MFSRRVHSPVGYAVPYLPIWIGARFYSCFGDLKNESNGAASAIRISPVKKLPCLSVFRAACSSLTQRGAPAYSGALFKEAGIARANFSSLGK
jgi:hypothetical protein